MPSPFPGMDPYLEHPDVFPNLHDSMVILIQEALQGCLPEPYYAISKSRVWIELSHRYIEPDVDVLRPPQAQPRSKANGPALLTPPSARGRAVLVRVPHDEHRESFLDIYTRGDKGDRLVTTIEVLSPANKAPGEHGRDLYLRKQKEIVDSKVHLVEIDLLRGGVHSTAVPRDRALEESGAFDYHVCIHCFDRWEDYIVYPVRLEERLPEIAIPLMPGNSPVVIDLQAIFNHAYDLGPYRRRIRYDEQSLLPPLSTEQAEWATGLLREKGLLPSG